MSPQLVLALIIGINVMFGVYAVMSKQKAWASMHFGVVALCASAFIYKFT